MPTPRPFASSVSICISNVKLSSTLICTSLKTVALSLSAPVVSDITTESAVVTTKITGNSSDLKKAIDIFKSISDYSDAGHRANELQTKYEEMLQYEKEQARLAFYND